MTCVRSDSMSGNEAQGRAEVVADARLAAEARRNRGTVLMVIAGLAVPALLLAIATSSGSVGYCGDEPCREGARTQTGVLVALLLISVVMFFVGVAQRSSGKQALDELQSGSGSGTDPVAMVPGSASVSVSGPSHTGQDTTRTAAGQGDPEALLQASPLVRVANGALHSSAVALVLALAGYFVNTVGFVVLGPGAALLAIVSWFPAVRVLRRAPYGRAAGSGRQTAALAILLSVIALATLGERLFG